MLTFAVLPVALRAKDPRPLLQFESGFERIALPALLVQVLSGLWLAHLLVPDPADWIHRSTPLARLVFLKLVLLAATVLTALEARLRILPRLSAETLPALARRVYLVTLVSVLFVLVGVSFRGGLLA